MQEFFSCAIESSRPAARKEICAPFLPNRYELASMVVPATSPAPGTSILSSPSSLSRGPTSSPSSAPLASSPASSPLSSLPPLSPSSPTNSNPITAPSSETPPSAAFTPPFVFSSPPLPLRPLPFAPPHPPPFRTKASHPLPRPFHRTKSSPSILSPVSSSRISRAALAGIAVAGVITVAILVVLAAYVLRKKRRKDCRSNTYPTPATNCQDEYYPARRRQHCSMSSSDGAIPLPPPCPHFPPQSKGHCPELRRLPQSRGNAICCFTYKELAAATDNFAVSNLLGGGGFGSVYKGVLSGDQPVAVKQLEVGGGQGEREFRAEVEIISRVHHRHLVSLVGYCISGSRRLLVYEFLPNYTLEYHLHVKGTVLSWRKRLKIALGAARGLSYLHEDCHPRIIHRDIKSSNILLDDNFETKVSDFGLAKLTSDTNTHVTTRVMGTFGYMAPEYASCGKLTGKSDVFSFGVVLLELVTGRRPIDKSHCSQCLVDWARPLLNQVLESCRVELLADSRLQGRYDEVEMMRMIQAAAVCVHYSADQRPLMSQVVRILEGEVTVPGFDACQQ